MEKTGSTILLILGILFVLGMGVGGYYLGRYLDLEEAKKNQTPVVREKGDPKVTKTYKNDDVRVELKYPGDFKLIEANLKDADSTSYFRLVNDNGSVFGYQRKSTKGTEIVCDESDVEGTKGNNKKCTYITDLVRFARYIDTSKSNSQDGEYWVIAENVSADKAGVFKYNSSNGFYYYAMSSTDLDILDTIMKSVVRK